MCSQASTLLQLPLEIRNEIYCYILPTQIHLCLEDNALCLRPCKEPDRNERSTCCVSQRMNLLAYDGYERGTCLTGLAERLPPHIWARRLRSTWGPHWMCEEIHNINLPLLVVCSRIYSEAIDYISRNVAIHVTDLQTIYKLSRTLAESCFSKIPPLLRRGFTRLDLTLLKPLGFFQSIDAVSDRPSVGSSESDSDLTTVQSLTQLGPVLDNFSSLTKLRLWLDHTDKRSWSLVNERAILTPIVSHISQTVDITILLPFLHPIYEDANRHFLSDQALGKNVHVVRKLRQRWRSGVDWRGEIDAVHTPDFPFTLDAFDGIMTPTEAVAWEREQWKEGIDVEAFAKEMMEPSNVQYSI